MTVDEPTLPASNRAWRCPPAETGAADDRSHLADPAKPADRGDGTIIPLVSPPPLITRVFPGL